MRLGGVSGLSAPAGDKLLIVAGAMVIEGRLGTDTQKPPRLQSREMSLMAVFDND